MKTILNNPTLSRFYGDKPITFKATGTSYRYRYSPLTKEMIRLPIGNGGNIPYEITTKHLKYAYYKVRWNDIKIIL